MKMTKKMISVLMLSLFCLILAPITAYAGSISTIAAKADNGVITVEGTAGSGVLAVAVMIYDADGKLIVMQTSAVNDQKYGMEFRQEFADGTYTVKAADYDGGDFASTTVTVNETPSDTTTPTETSTPSDTAKPADTSAPAPAGSGVVIVTSDSNEVGQVITDSTLGYFAEDLKVENVAGATVSAASVDNAEKLVKEARSIAGKDAFIAGVVDLHYSGTAAFTVHCSNVWKGQDVMVLHLKSDGTIERIKPDKVEDNKVTFTMTSYSPIAIMVNTSAGFTSPKTGEIVAMVMAMAVLFGAAAAAFGRKAKES